MKRRFLFLLGWFTALTMATTMVPAVAAQRGTCSVSHSWTSIVVVLRLTATATCTEAPVTINACIEKRLPNGTYVAEACGAGTGINTATAEAATVCVPGQLYRGRITWASGASVGAKTTAPVTCVPLT